MGFSGALRAPVLGGEGRPDRSDAAAGHCERLDHTHRRGSERRGCLECGGLSAGLGFCVRNAPRSALGLGSRVRRAEAEAGHLAKVPGPSVLRGPGRGLGRRAPREVGGYIPRPLPRGAQPVAAEQARTARCRRAWPRTPLGGRPHGPGQGRVLRPRVRAKCRRLRLLPKQAGEGGPAPGRSGAFGSSCRAEAAAAKSPSSSLRPGRLWAWGASPAGSPWVSEEPQTRPSWDGKSLLST